MRIVARFFAQRVHVSTVVVRVEGGEEGRAGHLAAVAPPVCCVNKSKTNNDPERRRHSKNNFQSSACSVNTVRG